MGTCGNAPVALQLCGPAAVGIHIYHWKPGLDYHRQQCGVSTDLEDKFHPTPISHYFPLLVLKLLYSSFSGTVIPSTERDMDEKGTIEGLKHHCVTVIVYSFIYTGNEPL